jgi:predicted ester cyclase
MSAEAAKALMRRAMEAQDSGNDDGFVALLSPDYRVHFPGLPGPLDREGHRQLIGAFRMAFPDGRHIVEEQVAEGSDVVTRGIWRGTHRGEFQGIPPTGREVTLSFIVAARVAGDRLAEVWLQADLLGLMQQIGAIPAPTGAAA